MHLDLSGKDLPVPERMKKGNQELLVHLTGDIKVQRDQLLLECTTVHHEEGSVPLEGLRVPAGEATVLKERHKVLVEVQEAHEGGHRVLGVELLAQEQEGLQALEEDHRALGVGVPV